MTSNVEWFRCLLPCVMSDNRSDTVSGTRRFDHRVMAALLSKAKRQ